MLAFALFGMTNVMANTSKDEVVEVSSTNKVTATEYYLEAAGQSGSGLFYSIEFLDSSQRKLKIVTKGEGMLRSTVMGMVLYLMIVYFIQPIVGQEKL